MIYETECAIAYNVNLIITDRLFFLIGYSDFMPDWMMERAIDAITNDHRFQFFLKAYPLAMSDMYTKEHIRERIERYIFLWHESQKNIRHQATFAYLEHWKTRTAIMNKLQIKAFWVHYLNEFRRTEHVRYKIELILPLQFFHELNDTVNHRRMCYIREIQRMRSHNPAGCELLRQMKKTDIEEAAFYSAMLEIRRLDAAAPKLRN